MKNNQGINSTTESFISTAELELTQHAVARKKQRGVKDRSISLVLEFGHYLYQKGKHTYTVSLDKNGIQQIKKTYGDLVELSKLRRMYVVVAEDSKIITCAYR